MKSASPTARRWLLFFLTSSPDHASERDPERNILCVFEHRKLRNDASAGRAVEKHQPPSVVLAALAALSITAHAHAEGSVTPSPLTQSPAVASASSASSASSSAPSASAATPFNALGPWVVSGDVPLPSWAKSVRVLRADEPVFAGPSKNAKKRGSAGREARLPVYAARQGPGCDGRYINVGPFAWICDGALELSGNDPIAAGLHTLGDPKNGLPYRYYFVGPDGSQAYKKLESVDIGEPAMQLDPGFAVAIIEEKNFDGGLYGRTSHNLWVPMRDLGPSRPSLFTGETLPGVHTLPTSGALPFAWVLPEHARTFKSPGGVYTGQSKSRFDLVRVLAESPDKRFLRIGDSQWIAAKDVRRPSVVDPPPEVKADIGEKWIDIDLPSQTLVAYEGKKPIFATLVSTGKGKQKTANATPVGTHRIWIKLLATDMDNLEDENASRYYRMESVPYPQFFSKGVGLHAAYWHRSFGNVRSHGCVNLAPLDAQRLFWWTGPRLPAGWTAVMPTPTELGTVIRVR
ncbi:MAG: L,D-transpeptidase [Polyangiaceae bacterium]|nr:L,D-transpeptidase [Polyangiaceae bacterium]